MKSSVQFWKKFIFDNVTVFQSSFKFPGLTVFRSKEILKASNLNIVSSNETIKISIEWFATNWSISIRQVGHLMKLIKSKVPEENGFNNHISQKSWHLLEFLHYYGSAAIILYKPKASIWDNDRGNEAPIHWETWVWKPSWVKKNEQFSSTKVSMQELKSFFSKNKCPQKQKVFE